MKRNDFRFFIAIFVIFSAGCSTIAHLDELLKLKAVDTSKKQMQRSIEEQEGGFSRLRDDIRSGALKPGVAKRKVIAKYGEPVISTGVNKYSDTPGAVEAFLYRRPMRYFDSDKAYLYFDSTGVLLRVEYKPFRKEE